MKFGISIALLALSLATRLSAHDPLAFASGSWFDPERNGEGFVVQVLPGERAVVTWFTYPPLGDASAQAWMIGTGSAVEGRIVIDEMVRPTGAVFGPAFDPDDVERNPWGRLTIEFEDCQSARAEWSGPPEFGEGSSQLIRLTSIDDAGCNPETPPESNRVVSGRSGPWYDPAHDGEGWMVETLADGRVVVYWFTYDDAGQQAWMIGEGRLEGRTLLVDDLLRPLGTHFGAGFSSSEITLPRWGRLGFLFADCVEGVLSYESVDPVFGAGNLLPVHLGQLATTNCADPLPEQPLVNGEWELSTPLPSPVSEAASVALEGYAYSAGGFGNLDGLLRFDPLNGMHAALPDMPAQRHHPMIATDGSYLYVAGGYLSRLGGAAGDNFWRYDPEDAQWEELPPMPFPRAAGAAVHLGGRIWIVGGLGAGAALMSYDLSSGAWTQQPGGSGGLPDHMQAVVFENEIWWLGGRDPQASRAVRIWNPVTREWRSGPDLRFERSGLAARVVQGQIIVSGGERIELVPARIVPTMEVFAPGADTWQLGPESPIPVHGVSGAAVNGELVLVGGSDIAGSTSQNTATQVYRPSL